MKRRRPPDSNPRVSGARDDDLFETVVTAAMRAHGWSRARAEAMAATVVSRPGRLRATLSTRRPPFAERQQAFRAQRAEGGGGASPDAKMRTPVSVSPAKRPAKKVRQLKVAHLRTSARTPKNTPDRPVMPDAGERRRGGRIFLQGGGPGLGRRR